MYQESIALISLIHSGELKSWDILQEMQISIDRFRKIIKKLLELNFVKYDPDTFTFSLTSSGDNLIKSMQSHRKAIASC